MLFSSVYADEFIHEMDFNYTVTNIGMTTQPRLNDYLSIDFTLNDTDNNTRENTHVHLRVYDDQNILIEDYTVKLISRKLEGLDFSKLNTKNVENSTGFEYYRTIPENIQTLEYRIVSDDSGKVRAKLFIRACGIGELKSCYFQTANYTLEIKQKGLSHFEIFTVNGEKLQNFSLIQSLSFMTNNVPEIALTGAIALFVIIIILGILYYVYRRLKHA
jgi:hypothetical protein